MPNVEVKTKYTEDELYHFIWRASTIEEISIAESWLKAHICELGLELFNDLMVALTEQYRIVTSKLDRYAEVRSW